MAVYDGAATRWAAGATLVYQPIADALVRRAPGALAGHVVLDVGAGTGVVSASLTTVGARPIAIDLSLDMLRWDREHRPASVAADIEQLPIAPGSVDDVVASFVLNHVARPIDAIAELAAAVRPGGSFLATTFADGPVDPARDRIDQVARAWGWEPPGWYQALKADVMPLLGSAIAMRDAAVAAGLRHTDVEAVAVDVGITRTEQLVAYRFGQAHVAAWFAAMDDEEAEAVRAAAIAAVEPVMAPYRPTVIFLVARTAG